MNDYFSNIEKEIYKLLLEDFDNKLEENDYIIYSDLIRSLDTYFNNYLFLFNDNIDRILNNTKERILRLQNINKALENLMNIQNKFNKFNFNSLIKILLDQKAQIAEINQKNENEMEKQKIIDSLDICKNKNNTKFIENVKEKIKNLDASYVKTWKKAIITPQNKEDLPNNEWPKIKLSFEKEDDFNIELIEKHKIFIDVLLRYSEIKKILDENIDNDGNLNKNNFFQMLIQLNEYDEMRNISNYIFNKIDDDCSMSNSIIKVLNSVLNCSFLKNLSEFCFNKEKNIISFQIIEEMFKYFSNLKERKIEKREIQYIISNYSFKYNPNFKIGFPNFKGMDLIYLFIDINNEAEIVNSSLIKDIKLSTYCLERLKNIEINSQDDNNFSEYLDMIVKIIFEEIKNVNNANQLEFVRRILKNEKDVKIQNLCKIIISLYEKKELEILSKKYIFELDDIDIYKYIADNKYIENIKFSQYPSLIFFMLNYNFDASKLFLPQFDDKGQVETKSEFMPFWLFCLRYFSSIECITSKFDNYFSKIIDRYIKNYFKSRRKRGEPILRNYWLNFVCNNNKSSNYEPLYIKIKLFLYRLSRDEFFSSLNNNENNKS